jgi:hypothetical protein
MKQKRYDAMDAELSSLFECDCFNVVPISEARNRQIVPCTWALRKKRRPDGSLIKYKARLCLRGDQMREELTGDANADEQDGYSPVVDWATIRMMLTVSVKYGLHATQVDSTMPSFKLHSKSQCSCHCRQDSINKPVTVYD